MNFIPLAKAHLCPDCDLIVNQPQCPLCLSNNTLVLARVLNRPATEAEQTNRKTDEADPEVDPNDAKN